MSQLEIPTGPHVLSPEEVERLLRVEAEALDYAAWCLIADGEDGCGCSSDPAHADFLCSSCRFTALLGKERVAARAEVLRASGEEPR